MVLENFASIKIVSSLFTNSTRPVDVMSFPRWVVRVRKAVQIDGDLIHIFQGLIRAVIGDGQVNKRSVRGETDRVDVVCGRLGIWLLFLPPDGCGGSGESNVGHWRSSRTSRS